MKINKKAILIGMTIITLVHSASGFCCFSKPPVTETYIVKSGDTLWDIAEIYIEKNTYAEREENEFIEGIIQLNVGRYPDIRNTIYPGDQLQVNYWVKDDEKK